MINVTNTNSLKRKAFYSDSKEETNETTLVAEVAQQALATQPHLSTGLWKHIKSRRLESGGAVHLFHLIPDTNDPNYTTKVRAYDDEVFPAVEFYPETKNINYSIGTKNQIGILVPSDLDPDLRNEFLNLLRNLRYSCRLQNQQIYSTLPDLQALRGFLQNSPLPYLKDLKIEDSDGISSDEDFVKAFFRCDCLLSNKEEFIHDHTAHLTTVFELVVEEKENYPQFREEIRTMIRSLVYEPLLWNVTHTPSLNFEVLWALMGKIIDEFQTFSHTDISDILLYKDSIDQFDTVALSSIETLGKDEALGKDWEKYFKKRFPTIELDELKKQWYLMLSYYFASKVNIPKDRIDAFLQQNSCSTETISRLPQMFFFLYDKKITMPTSKLDEFMHALKPLLDQPYHFRFLFPYDHNNIWKTEERISSFINNGLGMAQ